MSVTLSFKRFIETIKVIESSNFKTQVSLNALDASGKPRNVMDQAQAYSRFSAEKCANLIIKAIRKQKKEVYIGGKEVLGVYLKRFFPSLFARVLRKAKVT